MQAVIYAGLRNGARDQQIHDALTYKHVAEVAQDFKLSPNTIRAASKRIANATVYELSLLGGGSPMPIGRVAADCFRKAALGAYRSYHGTFRNLELPCWVITDGTQRIEVVELRRIDTGEVSP
ncbi:hypothetical protein [Pseudomonas chlororaphis]|uniref:hypothetical protein n=1 Tax=Pseudomonas chlororaphis TaxID=587753 RepID=UPI0006A63A03|nr:hypothetical protein [Pseudomonas chlororaphis]MBM0285021.1 hypothetical protein [Pseudomonas chlororaphis]MDO1505694.1 hypothetical protein [Pseudomonas chlororaphis]ORM49837.1 hypothetical protein B6D51_01470 [Pseudomonas chlororaphis subsp. chlororaphis]TWR99115.1 hypothetical protein FJD36_03885 [Pseudomonas chlororaphis subsp. chlororaphis]WDG99715.1 hypothetical protein PUP54_09145 [Pseudomonas chlororaphis]